jgi:predicted amidohydrolase
MRSEFGDPDANLASILDWMQQAAMENAGLVCFPEAALQGYCTRPETIRELAETVEGSRLGRIADAARALNITAGVGTALRCDGGLYNSFVFIGPDGFCGAQHKMHLCPADHSYDPGADWIVVDAAGWRVGATICFDAEYPEAARVLALRSADLVVMPFASGRRNRHDAPALPEQFSSDIRHWAPSRAYDNRIFVAGVNHAGRVHDPCGLAMSCPDEDAGDREWAPPGTFHQWPGYAFVIDPAGEIVAETARAAHDASMLVVDLDPKDLRDNRLPFEVKGPGGMINGDPLAARRIDSFGALTEPDRRGIDF